MVERFLLSMGLTKILNFKLVKHTTSYSRKVFNSKRLNHDDKLIKMSKVETFFKGLASKFSKILSTIGQGN
jgi:hypothetical protein